jgi:hypothetical protein
MVFQLINLFPQITKIREKGSQTVNSVLVDKIMKAGQSLFLQKEKNSVLVK